jgi:hypothetical protein
LSSVFIPVDGGAAILHLAIYIGGKGNTCYILLEGGGYLTCSLTHISWSGLIEISYNIIAYILHYLVSTHFEMFTVVSCIPFGCLSGLGRMRFQSVSFLEK